MDNLGIIKFDQNPVTRIGNAIALTNKLLALHNEKITILIANDHKIIVKGIKMALEKYPNIVFFEQAFNFEEVFEKMQLLNPDILLTDDQMPRTDILNDIPKIKKLYPHLKIIVHSLGAYTISISRYIEYINGYLSFSADSENYHEAFKTVNAGGNYFYINEHIKDQPTKSYITEHKKEFISIVEGIYSRYNNETK